MKYLLFVAALLTGFANFAQKNPNPFKALPNPNAPVTFKNPVIPVFIPTPAFAGWERIII
ncbi:MAG: hypothetical protein FD181_2139 [Prolixibacteraceae bacterium]|mgnify:CR=1 FL=1|nr:MAG: hypothetical protein FD181_2139 [Prolixibacteraceae bacterium]